MMKNYYDILGVTPDSDLHTIKFTYKALAKIYHPDTYKGDKKYAEIKMKDINEAYDCLSNKTLRKKYDKEFFNNKAQYSNSFDFNDANETSEHEAPINDDWNFAVGYHPELIKHYNILKKLNKNLAFQFKINIVESKAYGNALQLAERYIINYLNKFFGANGNIHNIAFHSLMQDRKDIAKKINSSITKLGNTSHEAIINKLKKDYKDFFTIFIDRKFSYESYCSLNSVEQTVGDVLSSSKKILKKSVFPLATKIGKIVLIFSLFIIIIWIVIFIFMLTTVD